VLVLSLVLQTLAASPVEVTVAVQAPVRLQARVFGASMDTPVRIPEVRAEAEPLAVLDANARAMQDVVSWVDLSARAVDLDDYGRFRLLVAAVDALPVRVVDGSGLGTVSDAVARGRWTADERLLAIGGGLRAMGVAAIPFRGADGALLLGISCDDPNMNVDSVEHEWRYVRNGVAHHQVVRWVLWDGVSPVGTVGGARGSQPLDRTIPRGSALSLADPALPEFTMAWSQPELRQVQGSSHDVRFVRHPDAAAWLSLAPELHLPAALPAARVQVRRSGLLDEARRRLHGLTDEEARIDALIRLVQGSFVYEPGPVRTIPELLERGRGDCDQLSLLLAALLLELDYDPADVVVVSWPDHLGLAVRPKRGKGPRDGLSVQLPEGRYVLLDVTHYMWSGTQLVSRWGRTSPSHGSQVTVERLR